MSCVHPPVAAFDMTNLPRADAMRQVFEMKCAIRDMSDRLKKKDLKILELQGSFINRRNTYTQTEKEPLEDGGIQDLSLLCGEHKAFHLSRIIQLHSVIDELRLLLRAGSRRVSQ